MLIAINMLDMVAILNMLVTNLMLDKIAVRSMLLQKIRSSVPTAIPRRCRPVSAPTGLVQSCTFAPRPQTAAMAAIRPLPG